MAEATMNVLVLSRNKNTFTPKGKTEPVTYFQALLLDVDNDTLALFRSQKVEDFETLVRGEVTNDFTARVDTPTQIQATMLRPLGAGGGFGGEAF